MSDLTALLEHEASAEIDAIMSEARERASAMTAKAEEEAEATKATRERSTTMQRDALRVRAQSAARLEASALRLRAQHEAVEAVYAAALERIEALIEDATAYEPVLDALLAETLAALGGEAATEIVVAERDVASAQVLATKRGAAAPVVAGPIHGGVRVRTGRGSSIENTLGGRLESLRGELASEITEVLFGETTVA
ncbi:MAG: V-type ATP synthase subunit E [Trueperaceae bacterium]|nr:V-type ATP synthase subunit E [Trueperaceae bacterium]